MIRGSFRFLDALLTASESGVSVVKVVATVVEDPAQKETGVFDGGARLRSIWKSKSIHSRRTCFSPAK